jgi:multidrug efflux pump subunit AcrB
VYRGVTEVGSYTEYVAQGAEPSNAVFVSIAKREGASAPVVASAVLAKVDHLIDTSPYATISYEIINNDGTLARNEIQGLMMNLIQSLVIVGVVLMLFLSPRAALVVMISIPLTMLIVFGAGYLAGQTVNRITLFALILSMGLLVDAAIVVVESTHTSLKQTSSHTQRVRRVVQSVNGVGVGLFLSMVTSVVVFMPMRYISGMMGPYMGPIAFFVPAALIVSFVIAVTLMPYLALALLPHGETPHPFGSRIEMGMQALTRRYEQLLARLLSKRVLQRRLLVGTFGVFLVTLLLPVLGLTHFQMLPKADRDQYYIHLDMQAGVDVVRTQAVARALTALALRDGDTESAQLFVAEAPVLDFNGMFKGAHLRSQVSG